MLTTIFGIFPIFGSLVWAALVVLASSMDTKGGSLGDAVGYIMLVPTLIALGLGVGLLVWG